MPEALSFSSLYEVSLQVLIMHDEFGSAIRDTSDEYMSNALARSIAAARKPDTISEHGDLAHFLRAFLDATKASLDSLIAHETLQPVSLYSAGRESYQLTTVSAGIRISRKSCNFLVERLLPRERTNFRRRYEASHYRAWSRETAESKRCQPAQWLTQLPSPSCVD